MKLSGSGASADRPRNISLEIHINKSDVQELRDYLQETQ
jgi:hypothetical protein